MKTVAQMGFRPGQFASEVELLNAIYAQHKAEGESQHGATFSGCFCDHCRMAREKNPALYNRPTCATCGAEKKWDGFDCRYVAACGH